MLEEPDVINRRRVETRASGISCVDRVVAARYQQSADFLDAVDASQLSRPVDVVVPGLEYAVPAAAQLARRWGLPGAGPAAAAILCDKAALREAADRAEIRQPRWSRVGAPEEIVHFAQGQPVVVKPANRQASLGVVFLEPGDDPVAAWQITTSVDEGAMVARRGFVSNHLVEQRVVGQEFSVEGLVRNGKVLFANCTAKSLFAGCFPVERGHIVPAPVPDVVTQALTLATTRLLAGIGFETGIAHAEWIVPGDGGPILIECAGRAPGDLIFELIRRAYEFDPYRAAFDLLRGLSWSPPDQPSNGAAVEFLAVPAGRVVQIRGLDYARQLPGVDLVEVHCHPGQVVPELRSSWDRQGLVVATAADAVKAARRARHAADTISVDVATEECPAN
ncbi:MAG: ATP-grasp domain-containing protein [Dermatophilaceae bacterium]